MNAVVTMQNGTQVTEHELIDVLKNSLYPGAADASVMMVMGYCRAAGLDVMKKPVHIVPIWNKDAGRMVDVIMPGIALYRTEAARTGEYVGKSEPEFGPDKTVTLGGTEVTFPSWCRVTVRRLVHGKICEFTAKEFWLENYATAKRDTQAPNAMWKKRAYGQLAKCTEAQALRMAFPEQTGGTNTDDEMSGKDFSGETIDLTPHTRQVEQRPFNHIAYFESKLADCRNIACVDALWKKWTATIEKAEAAGRPIAPETIERVQEMLGERMGEVEQAERQQAEEIAAAPVEEPVA
ncbi:phage recombination protein Bet [Komagataeibacter sp. FNDCF1]|uniref:phage recombination protein Bet n=1 Tax=Komagataeibacter sp. FNDCF1 TaxID=2878681 RepID=UPI001E4686B1|nr:phage recombination protein Bet [Komagataeibacter sp. FNDCF1]MCE2563346.1 phage recombination protein Bet [Komagataeibacter sp. FNDCF1]